MAAFGPAGTNTPAQLSNINLEEIDTSSPGGNAPIPLTKSRKERRKDKAKKSRALNPRR